MKNDNLLLEIQRMREIMGEKPLKYSNVKKINEDLSLITGRLLLESSGEEEGVKAVLRAMGFPDDIAQSLAKKASDEWTSGAKQFAETLEKEGLDDIGKIQKRIADAGGMANASSDVIENSLILYFKNNPEIAQNLLKQIPEFTQNIIKNLPLPTLIPDAALRTSLEGLLTKTPEELAFIKADLDQLITDLGALPQISNGVSSGNQDVIKLMNNLDDLSRTAEEFNAGLLYRGDVPADTPVILKDTAPGKTKAELDAEKAARDAEEAAKQDQAARDEAQKKAELELENIKNRALDNVIDALKAEKAWSQAWSKWNNFIYNTFGGNFGKVASYLSKARKKIGSLSLEDIKNYKNIEEYRILVKDLETKATSKGKFAKSLDNVKLLIKKLDELIESIPFLGKAYALTKKLAYIIALVVSVIFAISILLYFKDNFETLDYVATRLQYWAWDAVPDKISDFDTTMPECLSQIDGYWDLTEDQRLQLPSIGLSCDNIDSTKYDTYVSDIKYVEGSKAMDSSGKTVEKPAGFEITIGGKKITKTKDGSTNTGGTNTGGTTYEENLSSFLTWCKSKGYTECSKNPSGKWEYKDASGNYQETKFKDTTTGWR